MLNILHKRNPLFTKMEREENPKGKYVTCCGKRDQPLLNAVYCVFLVDVL